MTERKPDSSMWKLIKDYKFYSIGLAALALGATTLWINSVLVRPENPWLSFASGVILIGGATSAGFDFIRHL